MKWFAKPAPEPVNTPAPRPEPKTVEERIALGRHAKELLESEAYADAVGHLRDETMKRWRDTATGSAALREQYYFEIHAMDAVEARLRSLVEDAEYEAKRLEKANSRHA